MLQVHTIALNNPLSANFTKWANTLFADELFECVWPFCGIGAKKINILGVDKTDKAEYTDKTA